MFDDFMAIFWHGADEMDCEVPKSSEECRRVPKSSEEASK